MANFISLTCPSCGGKLQLTNDVERFACANCGNEHVVKRSGGVVTIAPVIDELKKVQVGVDKTASELAIKRLQEEIRILKEEQSRVANMGNETNLINQELEKKISDLRINEKARRSEKEPALLFLIGSCGFLAISVIGALLFSDSVPIGMIIIPLLMILLFGSRYNIASRNNDMVERQILQLQKEKRKQVDETRSKADTMLVDIDAKIIKNQKELEKHLRVVTD